MWVPQHPRPLYRDSKRQPLTKAKWREWSRSRSPLLLESLINLRPHGQLTTRQQCRSRVVLNICSASSPFVCFWDIHSVSFWLHACCNLAHSIWLKGLFIPCFYFFYFCCPHNFVKRWHQVKTYIKSSSERYYWYVIFQSDIDLFISFYFQLSHIDYDIWNILDYLRHYDLWAQAYQLVWWSWR